MKIYKNHLIHSNSKVKEALYLLNELSIDAILFVIDKNEKLIGSLTDGDIRRGLIDGYNIESNINNFIEKNPKYISKKVNSLEKIIEYRKLGYKILPVLDENRKVVNIINFRKTLSYLPVDAVIMAGGKGTRLEPFTSILPKPLIPINNKPIINHIIDKFKEHGIVEYYLSINYKSRILKAFFEESKKENKITFIEEKIPLGTIGALSKIKKNIKPIFFVTNCDIIINCDYDDILKYHKKNKNILTVVASVRNYTIPYGDCKINKDGLLINIHEKPNINLLANTGLYIMNNEVIKYIPKDVKYDLPQLVDKLVSLKKRVGVFPVSEEAWVDIGQWNEYKKAINNLNFND